MLTIPALPILVPTALFVIGWWLLRLHRHDRLNGYRAVTVVATTTYGAGVLLVTMFPMHLYLYGALDGAAWDARLNLLPITTIDAPTFNLNVAMMIPLGLLLPLVTPVRSWSAALRWGALISFGIESAQFLGQVLFDAGRLADVNDIIANSIGAVFGFAIYLIAVGTPGFDELLHRCKLRRPVASVVPLLEPERELASAR